MNIRTKSLIIIFAILFLKSLPALSDDSLFGSELHYPVDSSSEEKILHYFEALFDESNAKDITVLYRYPLHQRVLLDPYRLAQCFNLSMAKSEYRPNYKKSGHICVTGYNSRKHTMVDPTLFDYLAGRQRSCDWATGHELELRNWVMEQPDNSVTPLSIFKESYELNKGNVFGAILTIHQLLRPMARFMYESRYFISDFSPKIDFKSSEDFANKLVDFRGDLVERGKGFHGDHMGNWYRIWGTMLYQYDVIGHRGPQSYYGFLENISNGFYQTATTLSILVIAFGDELVLKPEDKDKLKFSTDARGAELINYLNYTVNKHTTESKCENKFYLEKAE